LIQRVSSAISGVEIAGEGFANLVRAGRQQPQRIHLRVAVSTSPFFFAHRSARGASLLERGNFPPRRPFLTAQSAWSGVVSILGNILGKIWDRAKSGPGAKPGNTAERTGAPAPTPAPGSVGAGSVGAGAATAPQPQAPQAVDVDGILDFMNQGKNLNWRTSIVDLMKLTGMDSSLAERKELAGELGYTGDTSDTATMNIWLHKQVIQRIKDNGGQIRDMTD
jgi:hypothetical protein